MIWSRVCFARSFAWPTSYCSRMLTSTNRLCIGVMFVTDSHIVGLDIRYIGQWIELR